MFLPLSQLLVIKNLENKNLYTFKECHESRFTFLLFLGQKYYFFVEINKYSVYRFYFMVGIIVRKLRPKNFTQVSEVEDTFSDRFIKKIIK